MKYMNKQMKRLLSIGFMLLLLTSVCYALPDTTPPFITAGPEVGLIGSNGALITWTTDEISDSHVLFGQSSDNLTGSAGKTEQVTNHALVMINLIPSTTYYAKVLSTDPSGNGPTVSDIVTFTTVASTVIPQPAKIGVFSDGYWYLDTNQSWAWDGTPTDSLGMFGLGIVGATPVAGDWNSDGKSEIGVYIDGIWYLDMNGNGLWDNEVTDVRGVFGVGVSNAIPVIGDWTGNGKTKIGIYADGIWYLDANQSWAWDGEGTDIRGVFGVGLSNVKPVTGDWNGDAITEIGVYSDGNWYLDKNRNWVWDGIPTDTYGVFGVGLPNVVPVTGDWNGDGTTKIGVYSDGNWYLDKSNSWAWEGEPTDTYGAFGTGLPNVIPVVGNW